ncbi:MAG TPA: P-loop NTPase fold protein [Pseudonocardiaceae bacterium]|nr:P-loop NTPase fold protein [Pseudonocardiaceae bacterium]
MSSPPPGFDDSAALRFVVLNDTPTGEADTDDLLEATQVARSLTDLIIASRAAAPFTLAIDAPWGMGKSSLMRHLETTLAAEPAVSTVWFNAWTSGQASALEGLIKSVLLRFDRNIIRRAVRSMSRRAHLLGVLRASALMVGSFFGLGRVVDEMWRTLTLDAQSRNQIKGVLRDAFSEWIKNGGTPDNRRLLTVFIDDLDRCGSARVIEICEAIKLYLDVPGIVFVLACDQTALWRAVRDTVGIDDAPGAVEYLEKIIQINYRIPTPSTSLATRLVNGYLDRSRTEKLFDESMKNLIIERSGRNPRRIKRLINSFVLEYHLNRSWDDIGVENLVKVVMLQHFYPGFYRILTNPRVEDPIDEFKRYHEFRSAVKQGALPDTEWRILFVDKDIRPPDGDMTAEALAHFLPELERELPVEFPMLAVDRDFVALVRSFDGVNAEQLRGLLRRPLTPSLAVDYGRVEVVEVEDVVFMKGWPQTPRKPLLTTSMDSPLGLNILWIDDLPETNRRMIDFLHRSGANVLLAADRTSALEVLSRTRTDVILSDFTRGGDVNAGIDDLAYLRRKGLYGGPVIFCSGQGSPTRQRRAEELSALGPTNDENQIVDWIKQIAGRHP